VPAATDILNYRGDPARTGTMPGPGPAGKPSVRWTFDAGASIASQVAVMGDFVYVVSTEGTLHALDLADGKQRWSAPIGLEADSSPTIVDGLVVLSAENGAHAFAAADGREVWATPATGPVRGTPAVIGHMAVFASETGTVTELDTRSGAILWTHAVNAADNTSLAAAGGLVVLGLQDGVVVGLSMQDGKQRWRTDTGDHTRIGTPTIAGGRVFVATLDDNGPGTHHIAALDLVTGRLLWRFASPGDVPAYTPAIAGGLAIVDGESGSVTALDVATGRVQWQVKAPGLVEVVSAVSGGVAYAASNGGVAFALDIATGAERWQVPIQGVPYGAAVTSGLVLVGTDAGILYAIGGSGT
jgi:outer membrane protein assembly factor BamB